MDIFKQKKNLIITIVILVILNFVTLLLLWLGKPSHNRISEPDGVGENRGRIQKLLTEELGFSSEQAEQFISARENHKIKSKEINDELMILKKEMFEDAMYRDNIKISDSLLSLSLEKQGQLEKITYEHFLTIKQICTPEQQKKLFKLMHRLLSPPQHGAPPPRGPRGEFRDEMPPPPRRGDRP